VDRPLSVNKHVAAGRHAWLHGGGHPIGTAIGATWGRSDDGKSGV